MDLAVLLRADPCATEDEAAAVRAEVECLITAPRFPETDTEFSRRYRRYVAQDPQIAAAIGRPERRSRVVC